MFSIPAIIVACQAHFPKSQFKLTKTSASRYVISGNNLTPALNDKRGEIQALHWFDNFWLYMEISLPINDKGDFVPSISISIFQGEALDTKKNQLFRAEWDSFENNTEHPQPHWHIYPNKYDHETYEEFETYNDMKKDENKEDFETFIQRDLNKLIPIQNMHFAMNAGWAKKTGHIHDLSEKDAITNWIQGILQHIKYQLDYVCQKQP